MGGHEVAEAFDILPRLAGRRYYRNAHQVAVIRPKNWTKEQEHMRYDPYLEPNLLSDFQATESSVSGILGFIDKYGLLTSQPNYSESVYENNKEVFEADCLSDVMNELEAFKICNCIVRALGKSDDDEILKHIEKTYNISTPNEGQFTFSYLNDANNTFSAPRDAGLSGYSSIRVIDYSHQYLYTTINSHLSKHHVTLQVLGNRDDPKKQFRPRHFVVPETLMGVIWHLMADLIIRGRGLRQCVICASWFNPPRSHAKTCSNACRQKDYRSRRSRP